MKRIIDFIRDHGVEAYQLNGKLYVEDVYSKDGKEYCEVRELEPRMDSVKEFLQY